MANIRRNKAAARFIVLGGTLLAALGIWSTVVNSPLPNTTAAALPITSPANPAPGNGTVNQPTINGPINRPDTIQPAPAIVRSPRLRTRGS